MAYSNPHGSNYISEVKLPNGTTYKIHDPEAVHNAADLGLGQALKFMGVLATMTDLEALDPTELGIGEVYLVKATNQEYVVVQEGTNAASRKFEALGNVHDAASSTHTHTTTSTGTATLTVTGSTGNVVTEVTPTTKYIGVKQVTNVAVNTGSKSVVTGVTSDATQKATVVTGLSTTQISIPTFESATVMTGLGTASTATVVTGVTATSATVKVVKTDGSAPTWAFSVANGVLTISGANGSAPVTENKTVVTSAAASGTTKAVTGYNAVATTSVAVYEGDSTQTVATGASGTISALTGFTAAATTISYATGIKTQAAFEPELREGSDDDVVAVITNVGKTKGSVNISGSATGTVTLAGGTSEPVDPS